MKGIVLFLGCCCLLASCEKEYLIPENELPQWLKTSIDQDLEIIAENSGSMRALGKWIRSEWKNEYYYEYQNALLCSMQSPISHYNDTLSIYHSNSNTNYYNEKCCEVVVWNGAD